MRKLTLRGIAANKGRLALTMLSIVLGVSFVSGSFVLADSLRDVFDQVSRDIYAGIDAVARSTDDTSDTGDTALFDESVVEQLSQVQGVAEVEAGLTITNRVFALDPDGEILRPQGPPVIAGSWTGSSDISSFTLIDGAVPGPGQVALDPIQLDTAGFTIGQIIDVAGPNGVSSFEISGTAEFGTPQAGPYFVLFDLATTQELLDLPGQINGIAFAAEPGADVDQMVADLQSVSPAGVEIISSEAAISETQESFGGFIDLFGQILLGFALVTLFVSIFIIYNTFAILVSQRTKQMGLLRAIGATGSQVRLMVLFESLVVGVIASIIGLFAGIGVAAFLKWLLGQGGGGFPDGPLRILPRTIIVVMIVGILVTVISAIAPAIRASRISPLEALRDVGQSRRSLTFRLIAGALVLVPGIVMLALGLAGVPDSTQGILALLGFGSVLTFIGVAMLSALFASPVTSLLGRPVQAGRGTVGRLARDNASRNPQRTAATATALTIGLALITGVTVLATSIKATLVDLLADSITADIFVFESQGLGFSPNVLDQLGALPEVGAVAGFVDSDALIDGEDAYIGGFDTGTGSSVVQFAMVDGSIETGTDGIAVVDQLAEDRGYQLGDSIEVTFDEDKATETFVLTGIYEPNPITDSEWVLDRAAITDHLDDDSLSLAAVSLADGVEPEAGRAAVDSVVDQFPQLDVQDQTELQDEFKGQIDALLLVINGILGLSLIVAFFGIVNTMVLSVLERTREIGLLRAVGMTRSQLRSSIRWEAVIVSLFGALLGVGMGVILATAGISAIPDGFIGAPTIPWGTIAIYVVISAILGVVAAFFPARRAAKLNILDAIATGD